MIDLVNIYLKINFFGQKIGNRYNVNKGVVHIILFEISFVSSGIIIGLLGWFGFTSPLWVAIITGLSVYLIWYFYYSRIENSIEFEYFEECYQESKKNKRMVYFILMLFMLFTSILIMIFSIKLIFFLVKA